jgi:hypothetical protein
MQFKILYYPDLNEPKLLAKTKDYKRFLLACIRAKELAIQKSDDIFGKGNYSVSTNYDSSLYSFKTTCNDGRNITVEV